MARYPAQHSHAPGSPNGDRVALALAARVLAVIYAGAVPVNLALIHGAAVWPVVLACLVTAVLCLVAARGAARASEADLVALAFTTSAAPLATAVVLVAATGHLEHTAILMLSLVGVAALNPSGPQTAWLGGSAVVAWAAAVAVRQPGSWDHTLTIALQLVMAGVLAVAVHQVRAAGLARLTSARRRLAEKVEELERISAEAELGHRRFRSVFDDSPVGIGLSDERGLFVEANEALCTLLGRSWAEIEGRSSAEFTHPDDLHTNHNASRMMSEAENGVVRIEKRYVRPDGEVRWAWLTVRHVAGPAGEPWTLAHVQDVTERKRTDEELIRSREGLRASVEIARAAQDGTDPRQLVLKSIASLAHVSTVSLLEPIGDNQLAVTATSGLENLVGVTMDLDEPSATTHVWQTGEPLFASLAEDSPHVGRDLLEQSGATSLLWQPVGMDGRVLAILALGWRDRLDTVSESERAAVEALAAETALALHSEQMRQQLERTVVTDSLTGLLNRRGWDEQTLALVRQSQRTHEPFTIALVDLDHFKAYNDTHGHVVADQALVAFGRQARRSLRVVDVIARWGGEEFAVALRDTDRAQAALTLERLRLSTPDGLTCSIGYAEVQAGESVSDVLARADEALYRAKRNGRNRLEEADLPGTPELAEAGVS